MSDVKKEAVGLNAEPVDRKALKRELRRILNGIIMIDEYDHIAAAEHARDVLLTGVQHGTVSSRLFGLSCRTRRYAAVKGVNEAAYVCLQAFGMMGRMLTLKASPDTGNLIIIPMFRNPSVMIADIIGNELLISVWTARTPLAFLNQRITFRKWEKLMDGYGDWISRVKPNGKGKKGGKKPDGPHNKSKKKKKSH